ncbi:HEPN domain-containing protein [Celeribacter sp. PS-C1]|uniref:HEPN domain-containing protein n=1 Tax=Celeribacter sp. PS-C1 TaxID=2820813 RepID=UPI001CA5C503|nr:HEPN domain-containing protein [Celeribacter sp. PS-C1]MBW6417306.1 hypothetical protein [Celeribacter sp. PS-C1]
MSKNQLSNGLNGVAFGIVLEDVAAEHLVEVDIGQGWVFSKASQDEQLACRDYVNRINSLLSSNDFPKTPQECNFVPSEDGNGFTINQISSPDEWRYCVVRPSSNATLQTHMVTEALRISNAELTVEHWGMEMGSFRGFRSSSSVPYPTFKLVDFDNRPKSIDFSELKECLDLRASLDEGRFRSISLALERFLSLGRLPRSDMKVLGYFSIIEGLLSHSPKSSESADSISRQLKRNLILIENRLPASEPIGLIGKDGTQPSKFISNMYSYRSDLAHGNSSTTTENALAKSLGIEKGPDRETGIDSFLRTLVRRILKQSLREPQLITDLKG